MICINKYVCILYYFTYAYQVVYVMYVDKRNVNQVPARYFELSIPYYCTGMVCIPLPLPLLVKIQILVLSIVRITHDIALNYPYRTIYILKYILYILWCTWLGYNQGYCIFFQNILSLQPPLRLNLPYAPHQSLSVPVSVHIRYVGALGGEL